VADTGEPEVARTVPPAPEARSRRSALAGGLRPLVHRAYRLMWLGSTTSALGDALVQIAVVFAVLHIGGTATDVGLVEAAQTVARVVFLLAGGVWADRLRRQYVMLAADAVLCAVQTALAVLLITGHARVWELGAGAAIYGAAASFFGPASTGLVAETVPAEELQEANSLLGLPASLFSVAGPAVAGVLIAVFGTGPLFAADAATFAVSAASLARLRVPPRTLPAQASFWSDLAAGWHELAIRPWYWINLIAHACWNFAIPAFFVLGPVIAARSLGGASAWGAISASWAAGAVAGGLLMLRFKPRRPLVVGNLMLTTVVLPMLALAFTRDIAVIAAASAVSGFGLLALNALWSSAMQVLIPDQVRSRVDSYDWLVSLVIMPVGFAIVGPLSASAGFSATLVAAGLVAAVPCALVVLVPGIRGVRRTTDGEIVGPLAADPAPAGSAT
jgi:MFS family permease